MTVRVVEQKREEECYVTCRNCVTILAFCVSDVECQYLHSHYFDYIVCPRCKQRVYVE
jgi:hypothetical protein